MRIRSTERKIRRRERRAALRAPRGKTAQGTSKGHVRPERAVAHGDVHPFETVLHGDVRVYVWKNARVRSRDVHPSVLIATGRSPVGSPRRFFRSLSICLSLPLFFSLLPHASFHQLLPRIFRDYLRRPKSTVMRKKLHADNGFFLQGVLKLVLQKIEEREQRALY